MHHNCLSATPHAVHQVPNCAQDTAQGVSHGRQTARSRQTCWQSTAPAAKPNQYLTDTGRAEQHLTKVAGIPLTVFPGLARQLMQVRCPPSQARISCSASAAASITANAVAVAVAIEQAMILCRKAQTRMRSQWTSQTSSSSAVGELPPGFVYAS